MPATFHVSDMHCVGLHCHAAGSHFVTDHLFVLLKRHLGDHYQFHNEEVELAVPWTCKCNTWFTLRQNFWSCAKMLEMHQCAQELRWKIMLFQQNKWATFWCFLIIHPDAKRYRHITRNVIFKAPNTNNCQWQIMAPLMELFKFQSASDHTGNLIAVPKG
jgi:hypothetical protein